MNKNLNEYQIERQKLSKELKPCPFCGGEARLRKHQKLEQTWYVQCNKCGMRTPNSVQPPYESWKTTMNYPVQLWNRRVENRNDNEKIEEMLRDLPSVTPQEQKKGEWLRMSGLSDQEDDRYKCSRCGNVVHYKSKMDLYTFNGWCGRCGSNNER